jgi:hypothetical protein
VACDWPHPAITASFVFTFPKDGDVRFDATLGGGIFLGEGSLRVYLLWDVADLLGRGSGWEGIYILFLGVGGALGFR